MEKIKEKLEKERNSLKKLEIKRDEIIDKIKSRKIMIEKYEHMLKQKKFIEATDVLSSKGLTLDEIMNAVKKGDLSMLQDRIKES